MATSTCFLPSAPSLRIRPPFRRLPTSSFRGVSVASLPRRALIPPPAYEPPRASATSPADPAAPQSSSLALVRTTASQLFSLSLLILIQKGVAAALASANVTFPAPLAAMLLLFALMIVFRLLRLSRPLDAANATLFLPGVAFLTRWLAVFFVPNLVMLPLAPKLPSADVAKIAIVLVGGFFASLLSSAAVCTALRFGVRKATGRLPPKVPSVEVKSSAPSNNLIIAVAVAVVATLGVAWNTASITGYAARAYALLATVLTFSVGQRFPRRAKMLLHPLITCTAGTIGAMALLGACTGTGFAPALASYYVRGGGVGGGAAWGGGNVLAALLGPAVITFAFTMDAQRKLALGRIVEVVGTALAATLAGLFGTAAAARALKMSGASRLLVVPRMITAPLAVAIAELLGANVGLAASVVALTGLLGANIGATVLTMCGVRDPVVRGLAVGASAHGLGTASLSDEGAAFPFAALAMTLVGIFSTVLVAYAPFRAVLVRVAVGKAMGKGMVGR